MAAEKPRSPWRRALATVRRETVNGVLRALPVEASLQLQYWRAFGRFADFKNPKRFTEKLQWIKLHGGLEAHSGWVDKVVAKQRVAALLGERWITPTLWHGETLPPRVERTWPTPYVIKANHGSGWCRHVVADADKDWPAIERECASWMRMRWHPHLREGQYAAIKPQLLVEPRLNGTSDLLPYDYKVHVLNGRAHHLVVIMGRTVNDMALAVMDRDWKRLPFALSDHAQAADTPEPPRHLDQIIDAAERLGAPFPYARIDFYDLPEGPRFGEVTLTPSSGFSPVTPDAWDERVGAMLALPERAL